MNKTEPPSVFPPFPGQAEPRGRGLRGCLGAADLWPDATGGPGALEAGQPGQRPGRFHMFQTNPLMFIMVMDGDNHHHNRIIM